MKNIKWFIAFIGIAFGVPLFLEFFIFRNNFPSELYNDEWASFLGSFLGGLISLIGIFLTIKYTQEENKKERELMYRPHIRISQCNPNESFQHVFVSTRQDGSYVNDGKNCGIGIIIKNIGLGPIVDFSLSDFKYKHKRSGQEICNLEFGHDEYFEKEEVLKLYFEFNLDVCDIDLNGISDIDDEKIFAFTGYGGDFSFWIRGKDLCGNPCDKKVIIRILGQIIRECDGKLHYVPEASLI